MALQNYRLYPTPLLAIDLAMHAGNCLNYNYYNVMHAYNIDVIIILIDNNVVLVAYYRTILVLVIVITSTNNNSFFLLVF